MWAIKIFDDRSEEFNGSILDVAKKWGAGIECALYNDQGMSPLINQRLKEEFSGDPCHALGLHLSHAKTSLMELIDQKWSPAAISKAFEIGQRYAPMTAPMVPGDSEVLSQGSIRIAKEAGWARGVGALDAVIHLGRGASLQKEAWNCLDPVALAKKAAPAIEACHELGLRLHLEKTYESRLWLLAFFDQVHAQGQADKFGFTLDIGHTRVWEREPLEHWMDSVARAHGQGFGLHFHLHGNPGDTDRHETLCKSQTLGWLDPDPEWAPNGALGVIKRIAELYENSALLVLENSPEHAQENLGWVELSVRE